MATPAQENRTQAPEAHDPHPTPISSYIGLGIMALIALFMAILLFDAGTTL